MNISKLIFGSLIFLFVFNAQAMEKFYLINDSYQTGTSDELKINWQKQTGDKEVDFYDLHDFKGSAINVAFGPKNGKEVIGERFIGFNLYKNDENLGGCTYKFFTAESDGGMRLTKKNLKDPNRKFWILVTRTDEEAGMQCTNLHNTPLEDVTLIKIKKK